MQSRPSWETYFMEITSLVATRSTCLRRKVGAVIVRDKRILATGYSIYLRIFLNVPLSHTRHDPNR